MERRRFEPQPLHDLRQGVIVLKEALVCETSARQLGHASYATRRFALFSTPARWKLQRSRASLRSARNS
jgi:hypothetical protein